ncbi:hypothetical protein [Cerasicoccus fimbriatus]|uniref:hypothetical protein n=1 Tax=Cerasicoccus fimbriatus TaxID=3014554 RepID=UPI0022B42698|nr:hypothetical protein [Cerasicoccus sp. TK19100]
MKRIITLVFLCVFLSACSSSKSSGIKALHFGMSPDQVTEEMGDDYNVVANSINQDGKKVTGWRYQGDKDQPSYMVYFVNGKLAQWGEAGALQNIPTLGDPDAK